MAAALIATVGCSPASSSGQPEGGLAASSAELGWWQGLTVPATGDVRTPLVAGAPVAPDDVITVPADALFFAVGSAEIAPDADILLDAVAATVLAAGVEVAIVGHTDSEGGDGYNLALGQARAQAVADQIRGRGVGGAQVAAVVSAGERCPIATNETVSGRAANRRVDVVPADSLPPDPAGCPTRTPTAHADETAEGR